MTNEVNVTEEGEIEMNADSSSDTGLLFEGDNMVLECTDVQSLDKEGKPLRSKKSGLPQLILEMTNEQGKKLWHYLTFIPAGQNGHGMVLRCLHAFGLPHDGPIRVKPSDFMTKRVLANVRIEQKDPNFDPKSVIKKFVVPKEEPTAAAQAPAFQPGVKPASQGLPPTPASIARKPLPWGGRR